MPYVIPPINPKTGKRHIVQGCNTTIRYMGALIIIISVISIVTFLTIK